ncbi:MAG: SUMF1/EgtB/PvdO family nonheme iron enzyme [Spirochaetaceae bacterium]|jgi:formylglycine-generating enzyme required for sulfatase activity|nr:SUMF1/EgtB/PvdO family nonheme iron enzyme [Spirochaetaceae bacterium]
MPIKTTPWYFAVLAAFLLSGCFSPTGPEFDPPAAPGTLTVVSGDEELLVSWEPVDGAEEYAVYFAPLPGGPPETTDLIVAEPTAAVEGLENGTAHQVWVRAQNAAGQSDFSPPGQGTPEGREYTITYDLNGGSGTPPAARTKWGRAALTLPPQGSAGPPSGDAEFMGWNTQPDGGGWGYMGDENYTRKASVTFYARWVEREKREIVTVVTAGTPLTVTGSGHYAFTVTVPNNPAYTNPGSTSTRNGVFVAGRTVRIDPFKMAKYETTGDLWITVQNWALEHGYNFENSKAQAPKADRKNHPVTGINWRDALVWCNAYSEMTGRQPVYTFGGAVIRDSRDAAACDGAGMNKTNNGFRLPTEVEREAAARGGNPSLPDWMFMYAGSGDADAVAWHHGNSPFTVQPVGGKAANCLGIYDLSGNVQEWCWDWMNYAADVPPATPADGAAYSAAPPRANQKAFNGGGVGSNLTYSCVTYRWGYEPAYVSGYVGFRVVCLP